MLERAEGDPIRILVQPSSPSQAATGCGTPAGLTVRDGNARRTILRTTVANCLGSGPAL